MVILGRCDGSYNIAKDSFGKIRNPNKRRYKFGCAQYDKRDEWQWIIILVKHISYECRCRFDM